VFSIGLPSMNGLAGILSQQTEKKVAATFQVASWPECLVAFLLGPLQVFRLAYLWVGFFDWVGS
jgi:hypothetical protein